MSVSRSSTFRGVNTTANQRDRSRSTWQSSSSPSTRSSVPIQCGRGPREFNCPIRARIGQIDTNGHVLALPEWIDQWWPFDPDTDVPALGAEVAGETETRALAFFGQIASRQALLEAIHAGRIGVSPMWGAAIAAWAGDPPFAEPPGISRARISP